MCLLDTFKYFIIQWKFLGLGNLVGSRPRPNTLQDVAQTLGLSVVEGGSERLGTGRESRFQSVTLI